LGSNSSRVLKNGEVVEGGSDGEEGERGMKFGEEKMGHRRNAEEENGSRENYEGETLFLKM
jgi:hypothetical protein